MKSKSKEDIGLKLGSHDMVLWTEVVAGAEQQLQAAEDAIKYQSAVLVMARENLEEAKRIYNSLPQE